MTGSPPAPHSGGSLGIEALECGPLGNNVYVVWWDAAGSTAPHGALVVDPAMEAAAAVERVLGRRNLRLDLIVATHSHWDHTAEAGDLARATGAPVAAHPLDAAVMARPHRSLFVPGVQLAPIAVGRELPESDRVALGEAVFEVLHTPGHTPGSICLYARAQGVLLSGDTLFAGSFGRYDLPGGDPRALKESLRRLSALPPTTRVLPGHGPETTIGAEGWLRDPPL
jgi:glyoxylase-like metal-dependent hydrolase (beta-lactamase superfamily II)